MFFRLDTDTGCFHELVDYFSDGAKWRNGQVVQVDVKSIKTFGLRTILAYNKKSLCGLGSNSDWLNLKDRARGRTASSQ